MNVIIPYAYIMVGLLISVLRPYEKRQDWLLVPAAVLAVALYGLFAASMEEMVFLFVSGAVVLGLFLLLITVKRWVYVERIESSEARNRASQEKLARLRQQYMAVKVKNEREDKRLHQIESIYEGTMAVSGKVDLESKIEVFEGMLCDIARFHRGEVVLLEEKNGDLRASKMYRFSCRGGSKEIPIQDIKRGKERNRIKAILKRVSRHYSPFTLSSLGVKESVFPITRGGEIFALIVLSDLEEKGVDLLPILMIQMALEIQKARLYQDVKLLSITDSLTGLYLRSFFFDRLEYEIARSLKFKRDLGFLIIDIDHFKQCNDTYGHLAGDMLLQHVAGVLEENAREIDLLGRYAGDEFVVVLPHIELKEVVRVGERIRSRIETSVLHMYGKKIRVTVSIGLTVLSECGSDIQKILDTADAALYRAKSLGRNRVATRE